MSKTATPVPEAVAVKYESNIDAKGIDLHDVCPAGIIQRHQRQNLIIVRLHI